MRRRVRHAAIAVVALLLLASGWVWLRPSPPAPAADVPQPLAVAPAPPEPVRELEGLTVVSVEGGVQRQGVDQAWTAVRAGDALQPDEAIRTGKDGRAVLGLGDAGRVELAPRSEFSVREISRTVASVRLREGRIVADVPEGGASALRIESRDGAAVAESKGGSFVVLSAPSGRMTVATQRGEARLAVGASTVDVRAGEQAQASSEGVSRARAIPPSLFLKVARPAAMVQRERQAVIEGTTTPGTVVSVNGLRVDADDEGRFRAEVALRDGRNRMRVEAEDALGRRTATSLPPITVKTQVQDVRARVRWTRGEPTP